MRHGKPTIGHAPETNLRLAVRREIAKPNTPLSTQGHTRTTGPGWVCGSRHWPLPGSLLGRPHWERPGAAFPQGHTGASRGACPAPAAGLGELALRNAGVKPHNRKAGAAQGSARFKTHLRSPIARGPVRRASTFFHPDPGHRT